MLIFTILQIYQQVPASIKIKNIWREFCSTKICPMADVWMQFFHPSPRVLNHFHQFSAQTNKIEEHHTHKNNTDRSMDALNVNAGHGSCDVYHRHHLFI